MIPRSSSGRWLAGAVVIVTLVIAFSLAMAVFNRDREPDLLPEGSPGRAVQDYILAVQGEDANGAYALLREKVREECDLDAVYDGRFSIPRDSFSIRLVRTDEGDEEATVTIEVTEVDAPGEVPLFGGSVNSYDAAYHLVREQGEWRLTEPGWPGWWCAPKATPTPPATVSIAEP
ncbi:MAG: hypothetical protein OXE50_07725 [Chloroflexi bacterium]|nr:hypothetical protein [Chloroflexota bacterium]